jgi:hypothetical protein
MVDLRFISSHLLSLALKASGDFYRGHHLRSQPSDRLPTAATTTNPTGGFQSMTEAGFGSSATRIPNRLNPDAHLTPFFHISRPLPVARADPVVAAPGSALHATQVSADPVVAAPCSALHATQVSFRGGRAGVRGRSGVNAREDAGKELWVSARYPKGMVILSHCFFPRISDS